MHSGYPRRRRARQSLFRRQIPTQSHQSRAGSRMGRGQKAGYGNPKFSGALEPPEKPH